MFHNVLHVFHDVLLCLTMICESRNDWRRHIGARAVTDRLRDRDNAAGIGDNSAEISDNSAEIGDNSADISDGAAGIVDIDTNVISCKTPSWMETGVTLFLEEKFQRGDEWATKPQ